MIKKIVTEDLGAGISRRKFLVVASCACAAGGACRALAEEAKPVDIGTASDFPKDGISDRFTGQDFFVVRREGRLYATTSICSHMAEPLLVDAGDTSRIKCSGHESVFDSEGRVMVGPATKSLVRLGITLNSDGHIVVDPARTFPEDKWEEKGSYLELK